MIVVENRNDDSGNSNSTGGICVATILMMIIVKPRTIIAKEVVEVTITVSYDTRSHRGREVR